MSYSSKVFVVITKVVAEVVLRVIAVLMWVAVVVCVCICVYILHVYGTHMVTKESKQRFFKAATICFDDSFAEVFSHSAS